MGTMISPVIASLLFGLAFPTALAQDYGIPADATGAPRGKLEVRDGLTNSLEEHQHGVAPTYSDDELALNPASSRIEGLGSSQTIPRPSKSIFPQDTAKTTVSRCVVPNFGATFECSPYGRWLYF
ncbi:hypothetical protein [Methylobacterium durans]|uniref:hypothetical protein n=1 Tax=Methylobacterium durans TaxID=2202825 RepID=UPI0013A53F01|nr:hypothetical protein [Methylobacterium durans]